MRLLKECMLAGAMIALSASSVPVKASTISVTDDSGGGTVVSVLGTSTGGTITGGPTNIHVEEINGVTGLNLPASYSITVTDGAISGGNMALTATGTETIGILTIGFKATGNTDEILGTGYILLSGTITSVTNPTAPPGYDFSPLLNGAIALNVDKTGVNYINGLGHAHALIANSGFGFQQSTVPEPGSWGLLSLGLIGCVTFRRVWLRPTVILVRI